VVIDVDAPIGTVFGYLTDPRNRPEWQSSLRRVDRLVGTGEVGSSWLDVTTIGARPRLEVIVHEPDRAWAEAGHWRGIDARLRLDFEPRGDGTRVHAALEVTSARRLLSPLAAVLARLAPIAVRSDLVRAARLLAARPL
jgi:hypothetical protein